MITGVNWKLRGATSGEAKVIAAALILGYILLGVVAL